MSLNHQTQHATMMSYLVAGHVEATVNPQERNKAHPKVHRLNPYAFLFTPFHIYVANIQIYSSGPELAYGPLQLYGWLLGISLIIARQIWIQIQLIFPNRVTLSKCISQERPNEMH